jgi:subtilisin family serine protease
VQILRRSLLIATAILSLSRPGVADEPVEFLVLLGERPDLAFARLPASAERVADRRRAVVGALRATAERSQRGVLDLLRERGVDAQPFWIVNMIRVRVDASMAPELIAELAARADVAAVAANPRVVLELPAPRLEDRESAESSAASSAAAAVAWGVDKIGAPLAWNRGIDGSGIVIGGQDTGYDWQHPALRDRYRGWNGTAANHAYNWHDSIHAATGNPCGVDTRAPCDDGSHGTHTMGTMVGSTAAESIGVAPGAKWIGCRNMDRGAGTPATYAECFQWFLAPTDLDNRNPDPSKAPDVINNSWGCPLSEGCTDPNVLRGVVEAVRAAGIVVVASAGNAGSGCSTVNDPAAIYDASFSIGATDVNDAIAGFSSRGPVTFDGSGRLKPDVSAPGVNVRSSLPNGAFGSLSGTSMAGPHVAGLVALLLQARPALRGNVDAIERVIRETAVPLSSAQDCGGTAGLVPNNVFGAGRVDAFAAIQSTGGGFADEFEDGVRSAGWSFKGTSWKEQGGALTATGGEALAAGAFAGCSVCTVETRVAVAKGRGGAVSLLAWRGGAKNLVEVRLQETENRWLLIQRLGNRTTQLTVSADVAANRAYDVAVGFDGAKFSLSIDGVARGSLAKLPGSNPSGTVGFRVAGRSARFEHVRVN